MSLNKCVATHSPVVLVMTILPERKEREGRKGERQEARKREESGKEKILEGNVF